MAAHCALILSLICGLLAVDASLKERCDNPLPTVKPTPDCGPRRYGGCCPEGWSRFQSRCFMFFHSPKSWIDAELSCIHAGGNLASVHSLDDNQYLGDLVFRVTGEHANVWVGAHDGVKEGVWLWSDGSEVDFEHWSHGEPNKRGDEHCLVMNWGEHQWTAFSCKRRLPFVCSTRSLPLTH
ncbi:hypothetical protein WMY93_027777 [Mugilogobius chulae]|uniref:C-type lectin domain-containing protein n=1 Tax=Mugilogobius chulae TaxID=88201 RepID=A0AAW0N0P7_9GOBI